MRNDTPNVLDKSLWLSFLEGNKSSYADIYQAYFPLLYEYGIRLCKDAELVKDCIQDLFIKLWVNRNNLQSTTSIKPYLLTALKTTIINRLDQKRRMLARADYAAELCAFELNYMNAEDSLIQDDGKRIRSTQLKSALNNLTERQKECIFLRFYMGMEYSEIADLMNISVKACYKIIGRAIGVMREYFKEIATYSYLLLFLIIMALSDLH